jgi:hypothetical protein
LIFNIQSQYEKQIIILSKSEDILDQLIWYRIANKQDNNLFNGAIFNKVSRWDWEGEFEYTFSRATLLSIQKQ